MTTEMTTEITIPYMEQINYIFDTLNKDYINEKEHCENDTKRHPQQISVCFPFKDLIDEVEVDINITFNNCKKTEYNVLYFSILVSGLYYNNHSESEYELYSSHSKSKVKEITFENVKSVVEDIYTFINNNKYFDKRTCKIYPFKNICDGKNVRGGKCCVCHDITIVKTDCNHHLCVECYQTMRHHKNDDDDDIVCPICRNDDVYLQLYS